MHDFMIKIGYTLFETIEQYDQYILDKQYDEYVIFDPSEFPMYMKLANTVYCDIGNNGELAIFSTVKPELVNVGNI